MPKERTSLKHYDDLHQSTSERLDGILLEQRASNLFDGIEVELIRKISTDCISVWRVFGCLADVIDIGPPSKTLL